MSIQAEIRKHTGILSWISNWTVAVKGLVSWELPAAEKHDAEKYCGDRAAGQRTDLYRGEDRV